jgi:flagellar basal body-associated protein FliL
MKKSVLFCVIAFLLSLTLLVSCGENASPDYSGTGGGSNGGVDGEISTETLPDDRKIAITATYVIESLTFNDACDAIESAVQQAGGYVSNSKISPSTESKKGTATYVIRIPVAQTDAFSVSLTGVGHIASRSVATDDVTLTYTDVSSRIATLEAEETRVRALLENAQSISEILTIESRLTEITGELTSLRNQLAVLENRVTYSTFNVTLRDVTEYTVEEEEGEGYFKRFGQSFVSSFKIFVDILGGILIVVVYLLPYALLAAGIILIIWLVKRRKKKVEVPKEEAPVAPQSKDEALPTNEGLFSQE